MLGSATERGTPREIAGTVLRGYPLAALLALSLGLLALIAAGRKIRSLAKRWSDAHVPIIVKPGCYDSVLVDLEIRRSTRPGWPSAVATRRRCSRCPAGSSGRVAGRGVMRSRSRAPVELTGDQLEIGVYPSDLSISGTKERVARARAALASRLTATDVYLTTTRRVAACRGPADRDWRVADRRPAASCRPSRAGARGHRCPPREARGAVRRVGGPVPDAAPGRTRPPCRETGRRGLPGAASGDRGIVGRGRGDGRRPGAVCRPRCHGASRSPGCSCSCSTPCCCSATGSAGGAPREPDAADRRVDCACHPAVIQFGRRREAPDMARSMNS